MGFSGIGSLQVRGPKLGSLAMIEQTAEGLIMWTNDYLDIRTIVIAGSHQVVGRH
jgi:hypothetical protein